MVECRLLTDGAGAGSWNMAVDEALLEGASAEAPAVLRFYTWQQPTLSLGYFQEHAAREGHAASRRCEIVRRASGGGAILHDQELTYSYTVPVKSRFSSDPQYLYDAFHNTLIAALATWSISAYRHQKVATLGKIVATAEAEPFLCFERRAEGDVISQNKKICGSAQRRGKAAVLQHGSILLKMSSQAPELPGIYDLSGITITPGELISRWQPLLAVALDVTWAPSELSPSECDSATAIQRTKFDFEGWTLRR